MTSANEEDDRVAERARRIKDCDAAEEVVKEEKQQASILEEEAVKKTVVKKNKLSITQSGSNVLSLVGGLEGAITKGSSASEILIDSIMWGHTQKLQLAGVQALALCRVLRCRDRSEQIQLAAFHCSCITETLLSKSVIC